MEVILKTTNDFFNKVAKEIRETFFPNENHGRTENKAYWDTTRAIELFSNGCLTYQKLIERLAKSCKSTTKNIHAIVEKYVVDFGDYKYTPKN